MTVFKLARNLDDSIFVRREIDNIDPATSSTLHGGMESNCTKLELELIKIDVDIGKPTRTDPDITADNNSSGGGFVRVPHRYRRT